MKPLRHSLLGLFAALAFARAATADASFLRDDARRLTPATRARAIEQMRDIRRLFHRDVFVETMTGLPADELKRVKHMRSHEEVAYFAALGKKKAAASQVNGVHILICRDPKIVQITVWPESELEIFTADDAERLRRLMVRRIYVNSMNHAVLDGIGYVRRTYEANLHLDQPRDGPAGGWSMAKIVLAGLGLWAVLLLLSSRFSRSTLDAAGAHPGVLAVMFGQVAAIWIHDRLFPAGTATNLSTVAVSGGGKQPVPLDNADFARGVPSSLPPEAVKS